MKLDARRIEGFLGDPGGCRVVLFYGDDAGLIRERATRLTRAVARALHDPFRVAELDRDAASRLAGEMATLPLGGGRRVVRVREANDAMAGLVQAVLAGGAPGLLILEAAGLAARSKLRALAEQAADAAAIACYPREPAALSRDIQAALAMRRIRVEAEALRWLESQLGGDQAVTAAEIEKLALYVGDGGAVDMAAAQACVGDEAGLSLEDAVFAATAGCVAATDRALELALAEGATPVGVVRAALVHVQRLQRAQMAVAHGAAAEAAIRALRPPVFGRRESAFHQALSLWSERMLGGATARLWEVERACKRSGAPGEMMCRSVVLGLAQHVAAKRGRSVAGTD